LCGVGLIAILSLALEYILLWFMVDGGESSRLIDVIMLAPDPVLKMLVGQLCTMILSSGLDPILQGW
jgi:hypothetical protein